MKTNDINIRDPFVLPFEGKYYMYGSRVGEQLGFDVYISDDLENWDKSESVFEIFDGFWATTDCWAPEVHFYNGKFYMFASFKAPNHTRATQILVSDMPDGKFKPHSVNPACADCICRIGELTAISHDRGEKLLACHLHHSAGFNSDSL